MKYFKHVLCLFMVIVLAGSLAAPAFAEGLPVPEETPPDVNAETTTIKVEGSVFGDLQAYRLFNLTTALNCEEDHTHDKNCYRYSYKENSKYLPLLEAAKETYTTDTTEPPDTFRTVYTEAYNKLASLTANTYLTWLSENEASITEVGAYLYDCIKLAEISPDEAAETTFSGIPQGYYLITETGNPSNENTGNVYSTVILATDGQKGETINLKKDLPVLEKKVYTNGAMKDAAEAQVGDRFTFVLTYKLPQDVYTNVQRSIAGLPKEAAFEYYQLKFQDEFEGLTYAGTDSTKIFYVGNEQGEKYEGESLPIWPITDGTLFNLITSDTNVNIEIDSLYDAIGTKPHTYTWGNLSGTDKNDSFPSIPVFKSITPVEGSIYVVYDMTLNTNAVAGLGMNKNHNTAMAYYPFDPYDGPHPDLQTTTPVSNTVYTWAVTVNKTDETNAPMPGADFAVTRLQLPETTEFNDMESVQTYIKDGSYGTDIGHNNGVSDQTAFIFKGLKAVANDVTPLKETDGKYSFTDDEGETYIYKLEETLVPQGYNKADDIYFYLKRTDAGIDAYVLTDEGFVKSDNFTVETANDNNLAVAVMNVSGTLLPETGGAGTTALYVTGGVLILLAGAFVVLKVRKKPNI